MVMPQFLGMFLVSSRQVGFSQRLIGHYWRLYLLPVPIRLNLPQPDFYHGPNGEPADPAVARAPDYFYLDAETAHVRLISH
jgi:hypothetical protein